MQKYGFILILLAILIAGCKSEEKSYAPPALAEEWTVKMTQSGGIMGLMRSIQVGSDGNYLLTDERAHNSVTGRLTAQQLAELKGLIANFKFTPPEIRGGCADCFIYDIEIESGGQKMIVQTDDVSLPDSGMQPLVDFLRNILEAS